MRSRRDLGSIRLKGIKRYTIAGTPYVYHRATGTRLPANLPENHPDFLAAYMAAEKAAQAPKPPPCGPGSVRAVWIDYLTTDRFRSLSESYRSMIRRHGDAIVQAGGHVPVRQIGHDHIRNDMSTLPAHSANARRKAWSALMGHAKDRGFRNDNPTLAVERHRSATKKPHTPWTPDDRAAFRSRWAPGTAERLSFEIISWTGARISDAVRLGPGMVDRSGWLTFVQKKTGGHVSIPLRRALPDFADASELRHLIDEIDAISDRHMTWIMTSHGNARSHKAASQWFAAAARAAGLKGRTAHGLRKARAIDLAEAGASTHQIGAWTGHESLQEIEDYSKGARKKRLLSSPDDEQKLSKSKRS